MKMRETFSKKMTEKDRIRASSIPLWIKSWIWIFSKISGDILWDIKDILSLILSASRCNWQKIALLSYFSSHLTDFHVLKIQIQILTLRCRLEIFVLSVGEWRYLEPSVVRFSHGKADWYRYYLYLESFLTYYYQGPFLDIKIWQTTTLNIRKDIIHIHKNWLT